MEGMQTDAAGDAFALRGCLSGMPAKIAICLIRLF